MDKNFEDQGLDFAHYMFRWWTKDKPLDESENLRCWEGTQWIKDWFIKEKEREV